MKNKLSYTSLAVLLMLPFLSSAEANKSIVLDKKTIRSNGVYFSATPEFDNSGVIAIDLAMNTHSVDLDFDLLDSSVLLLSGGQRIKPISWGGDPPGGHHRFGYLLFPYREDELKSFELVLTLDSRDRDLHFQWLIADRP